MRFPRTPNEAEINGWDKPLFDFRDGRGSSGSGEPCDVHGHVLSMCSVKEYRGMTMVEAGGGA